MKQRIQCSLAVMLFLIATHLPVATNAQTASPDKSPYSIYISTGDNMFTGNSLPIDSKAAIQASLDLIKACGFKRIYWRGVENALLMKYALKRPETARYYSAFQWIAHIYNTIDIDRFTVAEAHKRGIEVWGIGNWAEGYGDADTPPIWDYPFLAESNLRLQHPEWVPVDRRGKLRQAGPVDFSYPEARKAWIGQHMEFIKRDGYDGAMFISYTENFDTRFQDEFGFNEPVVTEFKKRYGIDLRTHAFTRAASRADWVRLRGEYLTDFYREMKAELKKINIPLSVVIDPHDLHYTQPWNVASITQTAGPIYQDLEGWLREGIVDEFVVFGSASSRLQQKAAEDMLWMTRGTPAKVSIFTSAPKSKWKGIQDKGAAVVSNFNEEEMFLDRGDIPEQPLSALKSSDDLACMRVLAQIIYGKTSGATVADLTPLTKHKNLLIRRMSLKALGLTKDPKAVPVIEKGLEDPENAVRCVAALALANNYGPKSLEKILVTVDKYGNHQFNELAVNTIRMFDKAASKPVLLKAANHANEMVRVTAMRSLEKNCVESDVPMLVSKFEDPSLYVRQVAGTNMAYINNSPKAVEALVAATRHKDVVVSNRAASSLNSMLDRKDPAIESFRPAILQALKAQYAQLGDGCTRKDAEWGYRPVGNALLAMGPEGEKVLQEFMNQTTDRKLAESAWKSLYIRQRPFSFSEVTEKENDEAYKMRPAFLDQPAATNTSVKTTGE